MDIDLNDKQQGVLKQIARDSNTGQQEWVAIDGVDLRIIRTLQKQHVLVYNKLGRKRLARVTARGWEYLGLDKPLLERAKDIHPMESEVAHEGHYDPDKARIVVESKVRVPAEIPALGPLPDAGARVREGGEETQRIRLAEAPKNLNEMIDAAEPIEGLDNVLGVRTGDGTFYILPPQIELEHDCEACLYREVIELLAQKTPKVLELVETLERARRIRDELGL